MARPYKTPEDDRDIFRALANPLRRRILTAALETDCTFKQIQKLIHRSSPTVSAHLRILREAKLITATRRARSVHYRANRLALRPTAKWLSATATPPRS